MSDKWYRPSQDVWCADTRIVSGGYSLRARVAQFGHREWPLRRFVFENEWISFSCLSLNWKSVEKSVVQESSWAYAFPKGTAFESEERAKTLHFWSFRVTAVFAAKNRALFKPGGGDGIRRGISDFWTEKRNWFPPPTFYRSQGRTCANKKPLREYSKFILIVWDLLLQHKFALSADFYVMEWVFNFQFLEK